MTHTPTDDWPELRSVPSTMLAAPLRAFGGPDVLQVGEMPTPEPGPGEVLVQVAAVSVGRLLDLVARSGKHPYATFTFPHVLGAEHVGRVAALGAGVDGPALGTKVAVFPAVLPGDDAAARAGYPEASPNLRLIGTHRPGADAQYCAVPAQNVFEVPDGISPADAVAIALAGAVAVNQLARAGLRPGGRVVVQGAASALGSTTALLARHRGHEVVVCSRAPAKRRQLADLGFEHVLDATQDGFVEQVLDRFGGEGADVVVDNLGEPTVWRHSLEVLAPAGAVVSSGAFLGHEVLVNLQRLYSRGQRVIGVKTGNLESAAQAWSEAADGFRSVVDRTFPLDRIAEAHRHVEGDANVGRVVVTVP